MRDLRKYWADVRAIERGLALQGESGQRAELLCCRGDILQACGSVKEARMLRSIPMLDDAAVAAIRQWKFEPTLLNGEAAETRVSPANDCAGSLPQLASRTASAGRK